MDVLRYKSFRKQSTPSLQKSNMKFWMLITHHNLFLVYQKEQKEITVV